MSRLSYKEYIQHVVTKDLKELLNSKEFKKATEWDNSNKQQENPITIATFGDWLELAGITIAENEKLIFDEKASKLNTEAFRLRNLTKREKKLINNDEGLYLISTLIKATFDELIHPDVTLDLFTRSPEKEYIVRAFLELFGNMEEKNGYKFDSITHLALALIVEQTAIRRIEQLIKEFSDIYKGSTLRTSIKDQLLYLLYGKSPIGIHPKIPLSSKLLLPRSGILGLVEVWEMADRKIIESIRIITSANLEIEDSNKNQVESKVSGKEVENDSEQEKEQETNILRRMVAAIAFARTTREDDSDFLVDRKTVIEYIRKKEFSNAKETLEETIKKYPWAFNAIALNYFLYETTLKDLIRKNYEKFGMGIIHELFSYDEGFIAEIKEKESKTVKLNKEELRSLRAGIIDLLINNNLFKHADRSNPLVLTHKTPDIAFDWSSIIAETFGEVGHDFPENVNQIQFVGWLRDPNGNNSKDINWKRVASPAKIGPQALIRLQRFNNIYDDEFIELEIPPEILLRFLGLDTDMPEIIKTLVKNSRK